jgi:hypothetical protein
MGRWLRTGLANGPAALGLVAHRRKTGEAGHRGGALPAPAVSGGHRRRGRWGTANRAPRRRGDAFWGNREDGAHQRGFTTVMAIGRWGATSEGPVHGSPALIDWSASRMWMRQSSWVVWLDRRTIGEGHHR